MCVIPRCGALYWLSLGHHFGLCALSPKRTNLCSRRRTSRRRHRFRYLQRWSVVHLGSAIGAKPHTLFQLSTTLITEHGGLPLRHIPPCRVVHKLGMEFDCNVEPPTNQQLAARSPRCRARRESFCRSPLEPQATNSYHSVPNAECLRAEIIGGWLAHITHKVQPSRKPWPSFGETF